MSPVSSRSGRSASARLCRGSESSPHQFGRSAQPILAVWLDNDDRHWRRITDGSDVVMIAGDDRDRSLPGEGGDGRADVRIGNGNLESRHELSGDVRTRTVEGRVADPKLVDQAR